MKDGQVRGASPELKKANKKRQKDRKFILTKVNRKVVQKAILDEAGRLGQEVHTMAISTTHVHMVVDVIDEPIETAVARYKLAGTKALRAKGIRGKVWTRGYDKRFCFDRKALRAEGKGEIRRGAQEHFFIVCFAFVRLRWPVSGAFFLLRSGCVCRNREPFARYGRAQTADFCVQPFSFARYRIEFLI